MITFDQVTFQYEGSSRPALDGLHLQIADGDFVGVIGASGAGKSTLTYAINGIVPHHYKGDFYGCVTIDGQDTVEVQPETLSLSVGSVFQDIESQIVTSVVEDEILFGLENFGIPRDEINGRIEESLERTGISELRYRSIGTLSGGQKQKVAIASIIALRPKILVLDEPTGELDPQSSRQIFSMLRTLNETYGMTIVVVEQKIMLLCEYAHRLLVMEQGRAVLDGTVSEVLREIGILEEAGVNCPRVATLADRLRRCELYRGETPADLPAAKRMVLEVLQ